MKKGTTKQGRECLFIDSMEIGESTIEPEHKCVLVANYPYNKRIRYFPRYDVDNTRENKTRYDIGMWKLKQWKNK